MDNLINIDGSQTLAYRYRMPPIESKIEGRGNGIKTVVPNMDAVARSLHVNPAFCVKWLGMELGAQSSWNDESKHAVVNGAHEANGLQQTLQGFINKYILCPRCKLPETVMKATKKDLIFDCKACGVNAKCSDKHKIVSFMRRVVSTTAKSEEDEGPVLDRELEARLDSAEAVVPSSGIKSEAEFLEDNVEKIHNFLKEDHTTEEILEHIRLISVAAEYDDTQRYSLMFFTLLTSEGDDPLTSVQNNLEVIKAGFTEMKGQVLFLKLLGKFFTIFSAVRDAFAMQVFHFLYEEDFLDEDVIVAWHDQKPERPLREGSAAVYGLATDC
ncbi:hypothetical protein GEMRC1_007506 [Eukaryota sp. GEM-RC1]